MRRALVVVAPVAALAVTSVAVAASLTTTSAKLTASTVAATVPLSTCSLTPAADTYADQLSLLSNFGTATTLNVRSLVLNNRRSFLRFDVAGCSIPTAARVTSAQLTLYLQSAPSSSRTYDLYRVTASWIETSLNWSNQPATVAGTSASFATGTTSGATLTSSVLTDVTAFVAGSATNNGWMVRDRTESAVGSVEGQFASRENAVPAQQPTLAISYYP
jgi:hypothetical protein